MKKILILLVLSLFACQTVTVKQYEVKYLVTINGQEEVITNYYESYNIDWERKILKGRMTNHMIETIHFDEIRILSEREYDIKL